MEKENKPVPLYLKIFQMTKHLYGVIKNFPKEHKYDLGREIAGLSWRCLDEFLEANNSPKEEKLEKILRLSDSFDKLKVRIRMGRDLDIITSRQFVHLQQEYICPTGDMIGGWLKWSNVKCTNLANKNNE